MLLFFYILLSHHCKNTTKNQNIFQFFYTSSYFDVSRLNERSVCNQHSPSRTDRKIENSARKKPKVFKSESFFIFYYIIKRKWEKKKNMSLVFFSSTPRIITKKHILSYIILLYTYIYSFFYNDNIMLRIIYKVIVCV